MASWELVPCGVQLRAEVDALAPNRDKTTDGTIGDRAHQDRVSDHNDDEVGRVPIRDADSRHEVHAWDADKDLREFGLTMMMIVLFIVDRCARGLELRLRYVIFDGWIWEASNAWRRRKYTGDNAHTEHAHFSFSYETKLEADRSSWHLEEIPVALTPADKNWLVQQIDARADQIERNILAAVGAAVLGTKTSDPSNLDRTVRNHLIDLSQVRDFDLGASNAKPGVVRPDSPLGQRTAAARAALAEGSK